MQVGREEFQELVADLGLDDEKKKSATATAEPEEPDEPVAGSGADLSPEDLVMKDEKTPKPKRPRNRRHGR